MLNKIISSTILLCSFAVMPITGKDPENLLFLFISPNKWVGTIRLALALALFFISFKSLSRAFARYPRLRNGFLTAGLTMITFGLVSTLEASLGTFFYDYLKPLDLMIVMEAGIVLTTLVLTTRPAVRTLRSTSKIQKASPKLLQETA